MEALPQNHRGMVRELCFGDPPVMERGHVGWRYQSRAKNSNKTAGKKGPGIKDSE